MFSCLDWTDYGPVEPWAGVVVVAGLVPADFFLWCTGLVVAGAGVVVTGAVVDAAGLPAAL